MDTHCIIATFSSRSFRSSGTRIISVLVLPAMGVPPCSHEPWRSHDRLPFQVQISVCREVSDILSDEVRGPARKRELDEDVVALVAQVWSQSKVDRRRDTDERDEVKDCLDLIGREPEL